MSIRTYTELLNNINVSAGRKITDDVIENAFKATPLASFIWEKGMIQPVDAFGTAIEVPVEFGDYKDQVKSLARGQTVEGKDVEIVTRVRYEYEHLGLKLLRFRRDDLQQQGAEKLINWLDTQDRNATRSIVTSLEERMFTQQDTLTSLELAVAEDPTTGIVGDLDRAECPKWRNQALDFSTFSTTNSLTADLDEAMRRIHMDTTDAPGGASQRPNLIVMSSRMWEHFEDQFRGIQIIDTFKSLEASLGFTVLSYKNIPVINSTFCPDGRIYFLNTDYIKLAKHPMAFFSRTEWTRDPDSLDMKSIIDLYTQLVFTNLGKQGVIFNLDGATDFRP